MKHALFTLVMLVTFCSACCNTEIRKKLDLAESMLQYQPDSCLTIMESIVPSGLKTKEEKARYALLMSAALDKNYIDVASDSLIRVDIFYDGDICPWTTDRIVSGKVSDYVCGGRWISFIDESGDESKVYVQSNASKISIQRNNDLQEFQETLLKMSPTISTEENVDCWFGVLLVYSKRIDTLAVGIHPDGLISLNGHRYHNPDLLRIITQKISISDPNWTLLVKQACSPMTIDSTEIYQFLHYQ